MTSDSLKKNLEIISLVITVLAVPAALFTYIRGEIKSKRAMEFATYDEMDNKYIEFLKLCLDNPEIDVYNEFLPDSFEYTPEQKTTQRLLYEILISHFERSYLMYNDPDNHHVKFKQWLTWERYIEDWMQRKSFRQAWHNEINREWDEGFKQYMDEVYGKYAP